MSWDRPGSRPRRDEPAALVECPEPGQRTWVDRRRRWEAPVEDGGHVACGFEVASASGCQHVQEWVLPVSAARASRWAAGVGQAGSW